VGRVPASTKPPRLHRCQYRSVFVLGVLRGHNNLIDRNPPWRSSVLRRFIDCGQHSQNNGRNIILWPPSCARLPAAAFRLRRSALRTPPSRRGTFRHPGWPVRGPNSCLEHYASTGIATIGTRRRARLYAKDISQLAPLRQLDFRVV
jgi:hypothetical protein